MNAKHEAIAITSLPGMTAGWSVHDAPHSCIICDAHESFHFRPIELDLFRMADVVRARAHSQVTQNPRQVVVQIER